VSNVTIQFPVKW